MRWKPLFFVLIGLTLCVWGLPAAAGRASAKLLPDLPALTAAEKFVVSQVGAGKSADLKAQFGEETNCVLRAAFLETLLTQNGTNVPRNGVWIEHALVLDALDLRNAEVHYETSLLKCRFAAEVNFSKSVFDSSLSLAGSTFQCPANFSAMKISRSANFDQAGFDAELLAAQMEITGAFTAREAHFNHANAVVDFTNLKIGGGAWFNGATFAGPVTFQYARLADNWRFDGCAFTNAAKLANFEAVRIGAATSFVGCRFAGYLSFKDAAFAELDLSKVAWPETHGEQPWLWLNGMTYQRISAGSEKESWQNLYALVERTARHSAYSADVFTGLEDYYRHLGYARQANLFFRGLKAREREEVLSGPAWIWSFFLDWFVGYGRSPERAIFWSVFIVGIGCLVFRPSRMEPQKDEYVSRKYSPFWYSMDVYLPVIKLHDAEVWKPREDCVLAHVWRRIHTILGWALIPIAIAAWTGMLSH